MALALVAPAVFAVAAASSSPLLREEAFTLDAAGEAVATITAGCARCSWEARGREAAVLVLEVDGRYSQHLVLTRGEAAADYAVMLGSLGAGGHRLRVSLDGPASASGAGPVTLTAVGVRAAVSGRDVSADAEAFAPFLYARPGTVERFSDIPLLTWYEEERTERGRRLRYSVVFTNEDGGTPVDRLMATWGRTTDVEFVYAVELDDAGRVLAETIQGKGHELVPFAGRREGRHPLLFVVTDNNMVGDHGTTSVRFGPAPFRADLADRSREAVMDDHPWTYRVSSEEVRREGRVEEGAAPGSERILDPGRFVFVEACAPAENATLAVSVGVRGADGSLSWHASDAGGPTFRVVRAAHNFPNGCFQAAVALPPGVEETAIRAVRFRAYTRPAQKNEAPLPAGSGRARLIRVNRVFMLDANDEPGRNLLSWTGEVPLVGEGPEHELPIGTR
jgi:hypothetical protein